MRKFFTLGLILIIGSSLQAQQQADYKEYEVLLLKNAAALGISKNDVKDAVITSAYTDAASQITYVYLQQAYRQIKVYNTIITATFRDGSLLYTSGRFVKDIAAKAGSGTPSKSHLDAVNAAAAHLSLNMPIPLTTIANLFNAEKKYTVTPGGIAKRNIDITLYWTPSDDKQQVALTWNVNIDVLGKPDWWNVRINALTGAFVQKDNWTVEEKIHEMLPEQIDALPAGNQVEAARNVLPANNQDSRADKAAAQNTLLSPPPNVLSGLYRVVPYPLESPVYGAFSTVENPWLMAGAGNNATTLGWHYDNVQNYEITRGNNVFAFLDRRANNISDALRNWPDTSSTPAPSLSFIHNINTSVQPFHSIENKKSALDNLFYWNNVVHDITYQYGFTEAAGNFQSENLGRGGLGNDYVNAHAQDSAGYNNANFSTPIDGMNGRMQMYTFSTPPLFSINSPAGIMGSFPSIESSFSTSNKLVNVGPVTGSVALYNDDVTGNVHTACSAAAFNAFNLVGKIVLIDATACTFASKVKKAQNAGAIAVLMYYPTLLGLGGTDNTVIIPCVSITTAEANSMVAQINLGNNVNVTLTSGIYLDGDLDNGIIVHEYGRGISGRLTGGPAVSGCLSNAEQGGEGWSDYFALMLTTNWGTAGINDGANLRPVGNYATGNTSSGLGIRRYPYTTNMTVNPLTYGNMATNVQVHAIGEIWCSTLWDMTWNIIQQQNAITADLYNNAGNGGNAVAMNLVMTGLKMQPCNPGYLDARNAILAADSILYNNAHKCAIWDAFARRGMGYSAVQGLSTNATDQTEAFDLPAGISMSKPGIMIAAENTQLTVTRELTCNCQPTSGYVLKDTIPSGFTYVSSTPAGTLNGNVLSFPASSFNAAESKTFSLVLKGPSIGCTIDSLINDNREASTTGGLVSSGIPGWINSSARSYSPASSWFALNTDVITSSSLTTSVTATTAQKNLSIFSFWHYFKTESRYDGGVVEYSTNGTTWLDAAPLMLRNTYTTSMDATTSLTGRKAFSGNSEAFIQTQLNLSSFGTTPVALRFRMETDLGTAAEGWYVDNIVRANGCGGFLRTGLYNNLGVRQDSLVMPLFVSSTGPLPLTLLWFYASQVGKEVALNWMTASEINVKDFTIEWSSNGTTWNALGNTGALNSNTNNYSFLHGTPVKGANFYRVKMNDRDGKYTYSPVRTINMLEKGNPMLVMIPNPVSTNARLYISRDAKVRTVEIFDAAGSLVRYIPVGAGVQQLNISADALPNGTYTIKGNGNGSYVIRMVVQH